MDPVRPEQMSDGALDREIASALNVEPSPAFAARVRQRIAGEPVLAAPLQSWLVATAGAALAVVLVVIIVEQNRSRYTSMEHPAAILSRSIAQTAGAIVGEPGQGGAAQTTPRGVRSAYSNEAEQPAAANRRHHSGNKAALHIDAEPEVLISAAESRAIRDFLAGLRDGRIDPASLPAAEPPGDEITIAPITITPMAEPSSAGVRQ